MSYAIPIEAPPAHWRLAIRPVTPLLAAFFIGVAPALGWMAANAFFLGCRDAGKQAALAAVAYLTIALVLVGSTYLEVTGHLAAWLGEDGALVASLAQVAAILVLFTAVSWMSARQAELADYQASLAGLSGLPWGGRTLAVLLAANFYVVPRIDAQLPFFDFVWGKLV